MQSSSHRCLLCSERRKRWKEEKVKTVEAKDSETGTPKRSGRGKPRVPWPTGRQRRAGSALGASGDPEARQVQGGTCHLHRDPAATSGAPWDPFAVKTRPLSAETSTGSLSGENGRKPEAQTSGPGRRAWMRRGWGRIALTSGENAWRAGRRAGRRGAGVTRRREDSSVSNSTSKQSLHLGTHSLYRH